MLKIDEVISGISVHIELEKGVCLVDTGDSGTGKTFLHQFLSAHFADRFDRYMRFDYNFSADTVISAIKGSEVRPEVIFLDNADLYMCEELIELLNDIGDSAVIILCMKGAVSYHLKHKIYQIDYHKDVFKCMRW